MNRLLYTIFYFLLVVVLASCRDDDPEITPGVPEMPFDRTVLVYMAAQNSLGASNFQRDDSLEIAAAADSIAKNNCLLVFIDDKYNPRIYQFAAKKAPKLVRSWKDDVSSVDPATLQDVLTWTKENFRADEYGLVMWSHSSGWIPASNTARYIRSFGVDTGMGGWMSSDRDAGGKLAPQMDIVDMADAINKSGIHLRFILFDSCLMGDIETAFTLRTATDYVIASPIAIHAAGGHYTGLVSRGFFCEDVVQIARTYFDDVTSPKFYSIYQDYGAVVAAINTEALDSLAITLSEVLPRSTLVDRVSPILTHITCYSEYSSYSSYRPKCYDALETMHLLLPDEADYQRWKAALEKVVAFSACTESFTLNDWGKKAYVAGENCICVSMFIPQNIYTDYASHCIYGDLNEAFRQTEWYEAAGWLQTGW